MAERSLPRDLKGDVKGVFCQFTEDYGKVSSLVTDDNFDKRNRQEMYYDAGATQICDKKQALTLLFPASVGGMADPNPNR